MKSNTEANNNNANDLLFPYNLIASCFDFKHETTTTTTTTAKTTTTTTTTAKTTNKSKL